MALRVHGGVRVCCLVGGRCVWTVLVGALVLRALVGRVVRLRAVLVACAVSCARVWRCCGRWYGRGA